MNTNKNILGCVLENYTRNIKWTQSMPQGDKKRSTNEAIAQWSISHIASKNKKQHMANLLYITSFYQKQHVYGQISKVFK